MTVYLFGISKAEADTYLATANTADCSWPGCPNAAVVGICSKTPSSAVDTDIVHTVACAEAHEPLLRADSTDVWSQRATTAQTTV